MASVFITDSCIMTIILSWSAFITGISLGDESDNQMHRGWLLHLHPWR